jgi:hypothetical protein
MRLQNHNLAILRSEQPGPSRLFRDRFGTPEWYFTSTEPVQIHAPENRKGPQKRTFSRVAGAGFEPATFGL